MDILLLSSSYTSPLYSQLLYSMLNPLFIIFTTMQLLICPPPLTHHSKSRQQTPYFALLLKPRMGEGKKDDTALTTGIEHSQSLLLPG